MKTIKLNFDKEEAQYKDMMALKKANPSAYDAGVLFNQQTLMACGKIDVALMQSSSDKKEKFMADNKEFFEGFAWLYYMDWKKWRAKGCAHLMSMYDLLNVKLTLHDFVGETFYAGIPKVQIEDVNEAIMNCQVAKDGVTPIGVDHEDFSHEKIGIDGKLHKTDKYGEFWPIQNDNDIYGDGTMVTKAKLDEVIKEPDSLCLSCKWAEDCNSKDDKGCEAYDGIY